MSARHALIQVREAIDAMNGIGFQKKVNIRMAAFGPHEAKAMLDEILSDDQISESERLEARRLREWLQEKCAV